jgi:hypothetical protein
MHVFFIILLLLIAPFHLACAQEAVPTEEPQVDETRPPAELEQSEDFAVDEPEDEAAQPATPAKNPEIKTPALKPGAPLPLPAPTADKAKGELPKESDILNTEAETPERNYTDTAILQGLNKITARISSFSVPIGSSVRFGNLEIYARLCWKASPEDAPDNKALLEIWEQKPGEDKKQMFNGWMFASSPALSALEHAVYDITVIECKRAEKKNK